MRVCVPAQWPTGLADSMGSVQCTGRSVETGLACREGKGRVRIALFIEAVLFHMFCELRTLAQDHSAASSSHGWQRARQLARTVNAVNAMGTLLDDVRSKQTETLCSSFG